MKVQTKTIVPLMTLFVMITMMTIPSAFAENEVTIVPAVGSSVPGCEETEDGCYIPSTATVDVGGVVIFSNTDNGIHTYTSGSLSDDDAGSEFDSGMLQPDQSFEYTPENVGEFPYFCMLHPWMQGVIVVQEAGAQMDDSMMDDKMKDGSMMDDKMMSMKMGPQ